MELVQFAFAGLLAVLGLVIGSFLNVAAIRALKRESVIHPPSHCVHCGHPLRPADLVPVISYLMLKGKCRYCGTRISPAYPVGELAASLLFAWVGWHFGPGNPEWLAGLLLVSVLHVVTHTDLRERIIPDVVVFTGLGMAALLRMFLHPLPAHSYVLGAAAGFALLFLIALISKGGMGGGDIKLYLFIGAVCGLSVTLLSLFVASLLGTVWGLSARWAGRLKPRQPIPFGPFIAVGAFLSFLYGETWLELYVEWLNFWLR